MPVNVFKDVAFPRLDGGLFTNDEESKIPMTASPDLQNIDFVTGGSFTIRHGTSAFSDQVSSLSGITTVHSFERRDGIQVPMRTWSTLIEYYNRQTSGWTRLSAGLTANSRFAFADYDGFTYYGNGVDAMFRWNGQYATVSTAHAASATVVAMRQSLVDWISAGEAIIGTQPVYYGSRTSGTLSAMTGISAAIADTEAAAQAPASSRSFTSVSSVPKGNILLVDSDRLHVAGVSSNYAVMYYSQLGNPTDFTAASPRTDDQGGTVTVPEGGGAITGLAARERGKVIIFKRNAIKGFEFVPLDNTTTDFPRLSNIANTYAGGAITSRGITNVESNVFFIAPYDGVRAIVGGATEGLSIKNLSNEINPTLNSLDPVSAAMIYHNKRLYVSLKDSDVTANNKVLVYDTIAQEGRGAWTLYKNLAINDWMVFDGDLYYASGNDKAVYKMLTGYTDNGVAYTSYWKSKLINHEIPHELKRLRYIYLEGYITTTGVLSATVYYDGLSADSRQLVIYGSGAYVDPSQSVTFGDVTFGGSVFGGDPGSSDVTLNKFRVRLSYLVQNCFNYQFEVKADREGTVYRIDQIVPYVERLDGNVFPVSNIIGIGS